MQRKARTRRPASDSRQELRSKVFWHWRLAQTLALVGAHRPGHQEVGQVSADHVDAVPRPLRADCFRLAGEPVSII